MTTPNKIRVLVIDDSAVVRRILSQMLSEDPQIEVVGTAGDPFEAKDKILSLNPDVLTLDIEMPRMDGLSFLKILMKEHPMPVIIISSLSQNNSQVALNALEIGAVDTIGKPNGSESVQLVSNLLISKVKGAYLAKGRIRPFDESKIQSNRQSTAPKARAYSPFDYNKLILIGSSTGGTEALRAIIPALPGNMPGICVVQHIPPIFSKAFAKRLNEVSELEVKEAEEGDQVKPGLVLIAPGNFHMKLLKLGAHYQVTLTQSPPVWHQRPAVDVLFQSAVESLKRNAIAAVLTGMGRDGANGLLALKEAGAYTIAQDEESSIVYGMPKVATEMGAAQHIGSLDQIANMLVQASSMKRLTSSSQRSG